MRKISLLTIFVFISLNLTAQITWDGGGGDNQWNTAANWVGNIVPTSTDDVLLDNSVANGSYSVFLPIGNTAISLKSLTISPAATDKITLTLLSTNTANPGLSVTGAGDALVLNNGAILKNSSGASAGSGIAITNTFRINNGGHYIHNTSRGNAAIVSQLSTAAGTELGEFEFDIPTASYTLSLSNRTYGNLTLSSAANGGTVSYTGNGGNPLNAKGDFKINTGVNLSIGMSADFIVHGNYIQASGSTFSLQSSTNNNLVKVKGHLTSQGTITENNTGLPIVELSGTTNQNISITGTITNSVAFTINNLAGATLLAPLTLPYILNLTNGKIQTSNPNYLILADNAAYTGGSTTSYIEGPMKKKGDDNFVFPVGKGSIYAPIGIVNISGENTTDEFTAEYIRNNPKNLHGAAVQAGLNHTSYAEYWTLIENSGTATKKISLKVNTTSFCYKLNNTFVSRWNGSLWTNEGSTNAGITSISPFETGTITSVNNLSAFGDFTLATDLAFIDNPLPLELTSFTAIKSSYNTATLQWQLATNLSPAAFFEIEKSADKQTFTVFNKINADATKLSYSTVHNQLNKGITYYRLKMTNENGKISYSKIVAVVNNDAAIYITSLSPNPVQHTAIISLYAAAGGKQTLSIYDLSGKVMKHWNVNSTKGENNIVVDTKNLATGVYYIVAASSEEKSVIRFVKQ